MTLIVVFLVGGGVLLIVSALDNSSIPDTFNKIINGENLDFSGNTPGSGLAGVGQAGSTAVGGIGPTPPKVPINLASALAWVNFGVSQPHGVNGETGIDIKTPQDTALGALMPGEVVSASYGPEGGDVWVKVKQGASYIYNEYVHLDNILVAAGQSIALGQIIGVSGGQLSGGMHNAQEPYSNGAHTEFGIYTQYQNPKSNIDPTAFINAIRKQVSFGGSIGTAQ